jgi:hypothetical protein
MQLGACCRGNRAYPRRFSPLAIRADNYPAPNWLSAVLSDFFRKAIRSIFIKCHVERIVT